MADDQIRLHATVERSRDEVLFWRPASSVSWNTQRHSHSNGQLLSLQSGLAIVETAVGTWMLPPGRCAWIPPGCYHSMRSCGDIDGWSIYLSAVFLRSSARAAGYPFAFISPDRSRIAHLKVEAKSAYD